MAVNANIPQLCRLQLLHHTHSVHVQDDVPYNHCMPLQQFLIYDSFDDCRFAKLRDFSI